MSTNHQTSRDYERLIEALIQQQMEGISGVELIEVSQDAHLRGASGYVHQIDVMYRFRLWNTEFIVVVECKQYTKKVGVGDLLQFKSRIEDLRAHKGLFVTSSGFQRGAVQFAKSNGIALLKVRGTEVNPVCYSIAPCTDAEECNFEFEALVKSYGISKRVAKKYVTLQPANRTLMVANQGVTVVIEVDELRPDLLDARPCEYTAATEEFYFQPQPGQPLRPGKLLKSLVVEELLQSRNFW